MSREEKKIKKYEHNKSIIKNVMIISFNVYVAVLIVAYFIGISNIKLLVDQKAYNATFIPSALLSVFGVAWGMFVAKIILFAICDHIIEMCYQNMHISGSNLVYEDDDGDDQSQDDDQT